MERRFHVLLAFALFIATAAAPRTGQAVAQTVFRSGVDLVGIDAVITDSSDRPVVGLRPEDFEVRDNGVLQDIAEFRYVSIPLARHVPASNDASAPLDVATNEPSSPDARAFVLVIDDLHLTVPMIVPVQRIITELVDTLAPDDQVAIVFVGHSNLSQNFTNDRTRLMQTVKNVRSAFGFGIGVTGRVQVEEMSYDRAVAWELTNIARALAHSAFVRRSVFFVGAYSQLDPAAPIGTNEKADADLLQRFMNDAWTAARLADVPIYSIDPRGVPTLGSVASDGRPHFATNYTGAAPDSGPVSASGPAGDVTRSTSGARLGDDIASPAAIQRRIQVQQDHLVEMALNTGGRAFVNRSNTLEAVDEAVADNGSFYELSYYPHSWAHDGTFHQISVVVKRPGLRVRAKPGYVAANDSDSSPLTVTLDGALGSALNVSGLTLRAFAAPMATSSKGMATAVTVEVAYPMPSDGGDRIDDDLQITVVGLDAEAKIKLKSTHSWHISSPVAKNEATRAFVFDDLVDVPTGSLTLRIGVSSKRSGQTGMVQVPVDTPEINKAKIALSGLALGLDGSSTSGFGISLMDSVVPFQPTVARSFSKSDVLRVFGRAFWSAKNPDAFVSVRVTGDQAPLATTSIHGTPLDGRFMAPVDQRVPLRNLAPGQHVLGVSVSLPTSEVATRSISFTVR